MANPCSTAARRLKGPPAAKAHDLKAVAHAHGSPTVLLRVCLRSNLRREPGRWPGVFPRFAGKASSVSPIPARIALQGGERASADAIDLSTPPTKTRRWGPRLPFARKEQFLGSAWPANFARPWDQPRQLQPDRAFPTPPLSRHTNRGVLAEPSNNNKKSGWGQQIRLRP
jgi:hypothetical protein